MEVDVEIKRNFVDGFCINSIWNVPCFKLEDAPTNIENNWQGATATHTYIAITAQVLSMPGCKEVKQELF